MNYKKSIYYYFIFVLLGSVISCQKKLDSLVGKGLLDSNNNTQVIDTVLEVWTLSDKLFSADDTVHLSPSLDYFPAGYYTDQYFGSIATSVYIQLKPPYYPFYLQGTSGNLVVDSIALGLKIAYVWGDSVIHNLVKYQVNEIMDPNFVMDTTGGVLSVARYFNILNNVNANSLAINPDNLNISPELDIRSRFDSFYSYGEAVIGQYRMLLNKGIGTRFIQAYNADTSSLNSDAKINSLLQGLRIAPENSFMGNNLAYISLTDTTTRLAIYYHDINYLDSPFIAKFYFRTDSSAYALNVHKIRNNVFDNHYTNYDGQNNNQLFLETQPGGYTLLQIPQLQDPAFQNIIVNQAILLAEVDPTYYNLNPTGNQNIPPSYIYLDKDSSGTYIPLPFDLSYVNNYDFFPSSSGIDFSYFGANYIDSAGKFMGYKMNLTRTVQNEIKQGKTSTYRLYAPILLNYKDNLVNYAYANSLIAGGRTVLVGNYKGQNKNPHRLRLHLIYTKIQ